MARETKYTANKRVTLTPEMEEAINKFRFSKLLKSETEALRLLIEMGLERANETKTPGQMVREAKALLREAVMLQIAPIRAAAATLHYMQDPEEALEKTNQIFNDEGMLKALAPREDKEN